MTAGSAHAASHGDVRGRRRSHCSCGISLELLIVIYERMYLRYVLIAIGDRQVALMINGSHTNMFIGNASFDLYRLD